MVLWFGILWKRKLLKNKVKVVCTEMGFSSGISIFSFPFPYSVMVAKNIKSGIFWCVYSHESTKSTKESRYKFL